VLIGFRPIVSAAIVDWPLRPVIRVHSGAAADRSFSSGVDAPSHVGESAPVVSHRVVSVMFGAMRCDGSIRRLQSHTDTERRDRANDRSAERTHEAWTVSIDQRTVNEPNARPEASTVRHHSADMDHRCHDGMRCDPPSSST
jgi:hypothetical protein